MEKKLREILLPLTSEDLCDWSNARFVARGKLYLSRVEPPVLFPDGELVAEVHGSDDYFAKLRVDAAGTLQGICTCPVRSRCKHCVALALTAAERLKEGGDFPEVDISSGRWKRAAEAFKPKTETVSETERMQSSRMQLFKDHFAAARQAVEAACAANDADRIRSSAEALLLVSEDEEQYYHPGCFGDDFEAFERVMAKVPSALRASGWSAADVIVWAYKIGSPPDRFSAGMAFDEVIDAPSGDYADQAVWSEVAERLRSELKSFSDDQLESGAGAYQIEAIHVSWKRAGAESKALDLMIEYVPKIKNWKEVAEHLNKCDRHDDAIRVARGGVKESAAGGWCYSNDYAEELMEPLAEAFSGKGDHQKAAAILAEVFLDRIGAYENCRSVESFKKVLKEAELAGVGDETRDAIIHALKTGVNPEPLVDWKTKAPVQEFESRPIPKLVSYRAPDARDETPRWPLPRSNEGLKFSDLRWDTLEWFCQQDQEFLLKLALADGDKQEVARRFDALPEFPHSSPTEDKTAMLEAVIAAVGDVRPDIAETIRLRHVRPSRPLVVTW